VTITEDVRIPKVAIVTGAGTGVGRAISRSLLQAGHVVVLAGRSRESLEQAAAGESLADVVPTDVTSPESVDHLFAHVVREHGRLDVLVNNAGIFGPVAAVDDLRDEDWTAVLATNVSGAVFCAREAVRVMRAQNPSGGRIINNGSLSAQTPRPSSVAYTISKHAITGLTASINLDHRDQDIVCTQIDVGNASTAMTARVGAGVLQADGSVRAEPTFDPDHVAGLVVQLAELPLDVCVPQLTIMARGMPFAGRG